MLWLPCRVVDKQQCTEQEDRGLPLLGKIFFQNSAAPGEKAHRPFFSFAVVLANCVLQDPKQRKIGDSTVSSSLDLPLISHKLEPVEAFHLLYKNTFVDGIYLTRWFMFAEFSQTLYIFNDRLCAV